MPELILIAVNMLHDKEANAHYIGPLPFIASTDAANAAYVAVL
jgi:hypothetical protein